MKPFVGQKLFSLNVGNAARNCKQELTPVVVTKVGNKYFATRPEGSESDYQDTQYHIEGWTEKTKYTANSALYTSEQEWADDKDAYNITKKIREYFQYGCPVIRLDKLRAINVILFDTEKVEQPTKQ